MNKQQFDGIPMFDFLKIGDLQPGMKIRFNDCEEILFVGNCTPHETTTASSSIGWDYETWKHFHVVEVEYDQDCDKAITPKKFEIYEQEVSRK